MARPTDPMDPRLVEAITAELLASTGDWWGQPTGPRSAATVARNVALRVWEWLAEGDEFMPSTS